jgi:hypothetical protein
MTCPLPDNTAYCQPQSRPYAQQRLACLFVAGLTALAVSNLDASESGPTGQEVYRTHCARCHGATGEGVDDYYPEPLHGDRPLDELTQIIHDTMPEDEPEKCEGDSARRVAEFIYEAFYTEDARAKSKPPRIELVRLTVRQYQQTVADLVAGFVEEGAPDDQRGLQGRYFNARGFRGDKKAFERLDPTVAFDFKDSSPDPDKIGEEEFSIQWQGGVMAEDPGEYEFFLSTENGARLWVNDTARPLIDAWVQSGDDTEHSESIRLIGGRVYPIRLDYFKSKEKESASVVLEWKPPNRAREVISARELSPNRFPPVLVVNTPFPPDDSSVGYERGTSVSSAWHQATVYAAVEIANKVVDSLPALAKVNHDAADREQRLKEFCYRFARRAFRRPLDDQQRRLFVDDRFQGATDLDAAVKQVMLLVLTSPRFFYLGIGQEEIDDYEVASRLSYGLWDSLPDEELEKAASEGKLHTLDEVQRQAQRMLRNPRTRAKLHHFFHQWLQFDHAVDIAKDNQIFPEFSDAIASDLRTSLDLFLDEAAWNDGSDFRQLLLADYLFVNERLGKFYAVESPPKNGFEKTAFDPGKRAGVLTHPFLMTSFAYHKSSSPIHRGVFLVRSLLGRSLKPPPMAVTPLDEGFDPSLTTRQRVALQTKPAACQTCHSMINPLGFSLEHYDAVGRYRIKEKGKPIDASGSYKTVSGESVRFQGARELAQFLAESQEVHRCFVEQLFHHVVKQPVSAYGPDELQRLVDAFAGADFSIQQLLIEIMKSSVLKTNKK